jgi:twinkle protein
MACDKCGSSDALSYKEGDEWGKCFSCGECSPLVEQEYKPMSKEKFKEQPQVPLYHIAEYDTRGFQERGITKTVAAHYGVKVAYGEDGTIASHFYPYTKEGSIVAYKERKLPKTFVTHGVFKDVQLFGQNVSSGGRRVIITEGELDCLAVAQAQYDKYSRFYPVVSIPSASQTNVLLAQRDWLRQFDEVILMLDQDEPGRKATEAAAKIIGYDKVKVCDLPEKDACDVLIKLGSAKLMSCIFEARSFSPVGIVKGEAVWEHFKRRQDTVSLAYPDCLSGLNDKIHGMRMGEIVLFTSGTGSGKSTVIKEIVFEILEKTPDMVGMVSLEESIGDTAQKFISMKLNTANMAEMPDDKQRNAFDSVFGDERLILLDHQGSVGDDSLTDKIEHLALMGCKYIILDHITIAVSEGAGGKTGNEAIDAVMAALLKIVKKHNIWLGVISHLRKGEKPFEEGNLPTIDDIKGSGSIKQISFDIVAFARNMVAETAAMRNTIKLRILKSRFTGLTGDCGITQYDPETGRLKQASIVDFE